ncbi:MAG: hypothetical protein MUF27_11535 [Acidobacteria bacterium]|jgi:hypothetical protein|nr:hypothetical protein [Acidobacteriota bacterium]
MTARTLLRSAVFSLLFAGQALSQESEPSLMGVTATLDLGVVHPERSEQFASPLSGRLRATGPWRVGLARDAAGAAQADLRRVQSPDLFVKTLAGQWTPLVPGVAVLLASGGATDPMGVDFRFEVKVVPTLDDPPGAHSDRLFLTVNDQRVAVPVRVSYSVAPTAILEADPRAYELRAEVDPSRTSHYAFERRTYKVLSNVPWVAEVTLKEPLTDQGSQAVVRNDAIRLTTRDGAARTLVPGQPIQVGAGPASGSAGLVLEFELQFQLRDLLVAGEYVSTIEVTAKPAAGAATAGSSPS